MGTRADRNTIVVGVDDSATASNVARWAAYLASALHAPLLVAHALPRSRTAAKQLADRVHARHCGDQYRLAEHAKLPHSFEDHPAASSGHARAESEDSRGPWSRRNGGYSSRISAA
ncbi:universal stress protein [Nocardia sp. CWNU-33]|uniref:universal stress protein n=1 Tax=Nocardia sp. CWNU-33 TaxID=3392117 RepID=UPI00398F813D